MGLKEKRIINSLQGGDIAYHQTNFETVTGAKLAVEIDWDQWSDDHEGLLNLNGYVLQQFTDSLNQIGLDAAAKEALGEGVKTVMIERVEDPADKSISLSGGTLTFAVAPAHKWDGVIRSGDIKDYLLENL